MYIEVCWQVSEFTHMECTQHSSAAASTKVSICRWLTALLSMNALDLTCRVTEKWQFLLRKEPNFLTKRSGWLKKRVHHTIWKFFSILKSPHWEDSKNVNIVDVVQFWIQIWISPQCLGLKLKTPWCDNCLGLMIKLVVKFPDKCSNGIVEIKDLEI